MTSVIPWKGEAVSSDDARRRMGSVLTALRDIDDTEGSDYATTAMNVTAALAMERDHLLTIIGKVRAELTAHPREARVRYLLAVLDGEDQS